MVIEEDMTGGVLFGAEVRKKEMKQFAKKQFVWKRAKGGSCCQKQGVMCFFGDRLELLSFTKVCCFAAGRSQSHVADARPIGGSRVCLKAVKGCGSASAEYS